MAQRLGKHLTKALQGIGSGLTACEKQAGSMAARDAMLALRKRVTACLDDVSSMVFYLHPADLHEQGLVAVVRKLLRELQVTQGIVTELKLVGVGRRLAPHIESLLFRVMQEALHNIMQHAAASQTTVRMEYRMEMIIVTIADNGRGFDKEAALDDVGCGFVGMRERIHLLNGEIKIKSAPGAGTRVIIRCPVSADKLHM